MDFINNFKLDDNESDVDVMHDQHIIISLVKKCRGLVSMIKNVQQSLHYFLTQKEKYQIPNEIYVMMLSHIGIVHIV